MPWKCLFFSDSVFLWWKILTEKDNIAVLFSLIDGTVFSGWKSSEGQFDTEIP